MKNTIRQIYFYAATLIFLIMSVIAAISLLNLGLKTYVFTKADRPYNSCDQGPYAAPAPMKKPPAAPGDTTQMTAEELAAQKARCEKDLKDQQDSQRQRDLVQYLSMLIVAAPLFWLHFKWVQKEWEETKSMAKDEKRA